MTLINLFGTAFLAWALTEINKLPAKDVARPLPLTVVAWAAASMILCLISAMHSIGITGAVWAVTLYIGWRAVTLIVTEKRKPKGKCL